MVELTYNYPRVAYYLGRLLRHTHWSQKQLQDYQDKHTRQVVRYAYENVGFYHDKMRQIRVKPDDVRAVADLKKLPLVARDELQKCGEGLVSREFRVSNLRAASTSGSSGKPLLTYLTRSEDEFRKAKLLRPHVICGQRPWDKWVLIEPLQNIKNVGQLQRLIRFYSPVYVSIFDPPSKQVSRIEELQPDVLDGLSNSILLVAREVEENGLETIRPRFIMGGAEQIDASDHKVIERSFDAPFYDQYASEELQMIAWQCPEEDEYHVDADSLVVEFVDEDGEEIGPGESGELVCTSLFNYAMPFLRYKLGDLAVRSEKTSCKCGRSFPLLKTIEGRKDSLVTLPSGRKIPPLAFGYAMEFYKFYRNVYQYRVIQKRQNVLRFEVKKKNRPVNEEEMRVELIAHIRRMLGMDESEVVIDVEFVDSIPLDKSGKLKKVLSEID